VVTTNDMRLLHELEETLRVFSTALPESAEIRHTLVRTSVKDVHTFILSLSGIKKTYTYTAASSQSQDTVEGLRLTRRAAKLGLYHVLREVTGITLPWGSLTGIRPTRLCRQLIREYGDLNLAIENMQDVFDVTYSKAALVRDIVLNQAGFYRWGEDGIADLYVGIPFCRSRCLYCSFMSADLSRKSMRDLVEPYIEGLLREIRETADLLKEMGKKPGCLYVGGGTPSSIGTEALWRVLNALQECFPSAMEWTVESGRPDTMDEAMLSMMKDAGVERISINPQTMQNNTLRLIGRRHTAEDVIRTLDIAGHMGFQSVNMDLIMGLPGETIKQAEDTLRKIEVLPIDNLTVHTLSVKRSSRLHEFPDRYPLPDAETVKEMVSMGEDAARGMGMFPYYLYRQKYMTGNLENVGYSLPGKICCYNIDMMEETHHIVAMGAGSISRRMYFDEDRHERLANPKNVDYYLSHLNTLLDRKREFFLKGTVKV
jgi:coproporphyrinogen dehydrogenase HemZ